MRKPTGLHYIDFFKQIHLTKQPEVYFEIGTQRGPSLEIANCRSISVDPEYMLDRDVVGGKSNLILCQQTSDDFFKDPIFKHTNWKIDFAFLDGMHLYEFLLRDFMNTEKYMAKGGVIALHDCLPYNIEMAARNRVTSAWTGDVWKVVPILQKYRPDLEVTVYDAAPTGIVIIKNFDPSNRILQDNYDQIILEFDQIDNVEEYVNNVVITPTRQSPWRSIPKLAKTDKLHFAIQTPVPRPRGSGGWGDWHYATSLQRAIQRLGHEADVRTKMEWFKRRSDFEIDIVLRGLEQFNPASNHLCLYWVISNTDKITNDELKGADAIFAASPLLVEDYQKALGEHADVSLLPQAFDKDHLPKQVPVNRDGIAFVGMNRPTFTRPMVDYACSTETEFNLWGSRWEGTHAAKQLKGERVPNANLLTIYSAHKIVLNDHTPQMRDAGLTSNRIFDALASGAAVISDDVKWIPSDFEPFVTRVNTKEEFLKAIEQINKESKTKQDERKKFATKMIDEHSFDARAKVIVEKAIQKISAK